jgi:Ca-activated chloride channel homolog
LNFASRYYLWLLLAIPPGMILFYWWSWRARQKLMAQFIQARLLAGLVCGVSAARQKVRAACLVLAAACLILALAQPQWGYDLEEVMQRGLDIVVAVDTSKSMLAEDIAPNRLARAKLAALDLMQDARPDRLGLVAFAGNAFLQCPLTVDDTVFRQSVETLNTDTIPQGGTALAAAIETALEAFKEGDHFKVLVILTDGEDHDSGALAAAKKAAAAGLRIFTIGIGSVQGELLRVKEPDGKEDYIRDEQGNVVKSHLNESLLQEIAGAANGFYLPLRGANTMDTLYRRGLAPLPKSSSQEKWIRRAHDRYYWPLALAILLLVTEMLLPERKREPGKSGAPAKPALAAAALLLLLLLPAAASGSPSSALREYKSGRYDQSLKDYEQSLQRNSDDPRLHFNAGAAAYRDQQYDQAAKHFGQALISPDLNLQEQAYYNLGNTLYYLGERNPDASKKSQSWEDALKRYESSLKLNPQDADARFNYEFVKKRLEELKKQQQQQQQQSQQNQSRKNQQQQQNQQQNQQSEQSKNDRQQPSQSSSPQDQKQNPSQHPEQAQNQPEPNQQPQQEPKPSEPKQDRQQPQQANESSGQKKDDQQSAGQPESNAKYAAGEMTPQQARQLLDAQKGGELLLPYNRNKRSADQQRPAKDW